MSEKPPITIASLPWTNQSSPTAHGSMVFRLGVHGGRAVDVALRAPSVGADEDIHGKPGKGIAVGRAVDVLALVRELASHVDELINGQGGPGRRRSDAGGLEHALVVKQHVGA